MESLEGRHVRNPWDLRSNTLNTEKMEQLCKGGGGGQGREGERRGEEADTEEKCCGSMAGGSWGSKQNVVTGTGLRRLESCVGGTVRGEKSDNRIQINKTTPAVPWLLEDAANPQRRDDGSLWQDRSIPWSLVPHLGVPEAWAWRNPRSLQLQALRARGLVFQILKPNGMGKEKWLSS